MPVIKKREIENLEQLSGEQLKDFLERLPASKEKFEELFDYLENRLEKSPCSHSLTNSMQFMLKNRMDFAQVTAWLNANGAYCDCKVLEYVATQLRKVFDKIDNSDEIDDSTNQ